MEREVMRRAVTATRQLQSLVLRWWRVSIRSYASSPIDSLGYNVSVSLRPFQDPKSSLPPPTVEENDEEKDRVADETTVGGVEEESQLVVSQQHRTARQRRPVNRLTVQRRRRERPIAS